MAKIIRKVSTRRDIDNRESNPKYGNFTIGFGSIGKECARELYYGLHWVAKGTISAKTQRIFNIGHMFESMAIADLKSVGIDVFKRIDGEKIEMTGEKDEVQEKLIGVTGHSKGKPDGRCLGIMENPLLEHLLELKTMNQKNFDKVLSLGVYNADKVYFGQVQRCMEAMKLECCFFLAINKNTCEYYGEFILFDPAYAKDLVRKEISIITSIEPPVRGFPKGHYKCDWCSKKSVCEKDIEPEINCRTCEYSDLENDGKWSCNNNKAIDLRTDGRCEDEYILSADEQMAGCDFYKKGWGL